MTTTNTSTPGVYIDEINAFPNSVVPIATAVPAFIGYTPKAEYEGKSYLYKPVKITSFAEFQAIFMVDSPTSTGQAVQYHPEYYLVEQSSKPSAGDCLAINGSFYSVLPDPSTIYYLYNSIRLFYQNGGGDAYIVSVGNYGAPAKKPMATAGHIINPNVQLSDLQHGVALLKDEAEPTLYICPDATLLSVAENGTLMQSMLLQATQMQTAMCIFDIIGGRNPDPILYTQDIENFRNNTGTIGLDYGVSYYPFIGTTIMQSLEIDFTNLFGGDIKQLEPLLNPSSSPNNTVAKILQLIENPPATNAMSATQLNAALLTASPVYSQIISHILNDANILPPSAGMAGVYTTNDNTAGIWHAPANTSIVGAAHLPIQLSDAQQANLNVDAVSGKSVNAIRFFNGLGILVWGARTLDGNSTEWRYVPVRRTLIFLEQSIKAAARAYVFAPNDANTWEAIKSMISSFLTSIWKEGGLQGTSATDAFQVSCGLGSTMTAEDILNGYLRVGVKVAVIRPAEFIFLTIEQQQTAQ